MYPSENIMYALFMHNTKSYWKCSIGYVISLLFILVTSSVYCDFSTNTIVFVILYIISLWILAIWITVVFLRQLFRENKFQNWKIFERYQNRNDDVPHMESNIPKLAENIETQFIKYWYNEISKDEKFPSECKILIENSLKTFTDVFLKINKTHLVYVLGNVYLKHLKEFRRTLRIKEKNETEVMDLYRFSFPVRPKSKFYIHQLTKNSLINFIHWELWNSIPCQIVISIISDKLSYLMKLCSKPEFLNYYLLKQIISTQQNCELKLENYSYIKINVIDEQLKTIFETVIKEDNNSNDKMETKIVTKKNEEEVVTDCIKPGIDIVRLDDNTSINGSGNLVKIYEPKSATKTWNEVLDLESISLGEDPLGSLMNSYNSSEIEEVIKNDTHKGDATASTLRDFKGFQENTVNTVMKPMSHATSQALHKIGDLQDEAAGVVEGLFDFGMAGIRKGLKLTGLQENSSVVGECSKPKVSPSVKNTSKKVKRLSKAEIAEEFLWVNPLQANPSFEDEAIGEPSKIDNVPSIMMNSSENESPDPEYEETADLATTIARLRSLLQQKSSESTATTPIVSPMISEDIKSASDLDDVDSFVPNLYKLCAKTATGVFNNTLNTLKTALPVNASEIIIYDMEQWDYSEIETKDVNSVSRMKRLLYDRKDFCVIETAFDAFDSQQPLQEQKCLSQINFQDELDDFESEVPLAKTMVDIICELISDFDTFFSQEPFVKFILLVLGKFIDDLISNKTGEFLDNVSVTEIPSTQNKKTLTLDLEVYVDYLLSGIPDSLNILIGKSTLREALTFLISSLQIEKCNQEVISQVFEFLSLRLMEDSSKNSLHLQY